jgi:hypothetical protein
MSGPNRRGNYQRTPHHRKVGEGVCRVCGTQQDLHADHCPRDYRLMSRIAHHYNLNIMQWNCLSDVARNLAAVRQWSDLHISFLYLMGYITSATLDAKVTEQGETMIRIVTQHIERAVARRNRRAQESGSIEELALPALVNTADILQNRIQVIRNLAHVTAPLDIAEHRALASVMRMLGGRWNDNRNGYVFTARDPQALIDAYINHERHSQKG